MLGDDAVTFELRGLWTGTRGCSDRNFGTGSIPVTKTMQWTYANQTWHLLYHYAVGDEQFWIWHVDGQRQYLQLTGPEEWTAATEWDFENAGAGHTYRLAAPIHTVRDLRDSPTGADIAISKTGTTATLNATLTGEAAQPFQVRFGEGVNEGQPITATRVRFDLSIDQLEGTLKEYTLDILWPLREGDDRFVNCRGFREHGIGVTPAVQPTIPAALLDLL